MRTNPGNNSIKEISKLNIITEEIGNMPGFTKRVKEEISLKEIDQEIDTLRKILRNLEKDKDTEEALKNYLILRLISFYERWVHDTLVKEIDLLPKENQRSLFDREVKINPDDLLKLDGLTVGRLAVSGLDNSPNSLNYIILRLLKAKYSNSKIRINDKFNFFNFLDYSTDILHPTLKTAHQSSGSWFQLVKNLNLQRNSIVHELRSTDMSNESILQSFILFQGFFKIFPALVRLLLYTNDPDYSKEDLVKHYGSLSDEIFKTKSFDELNGKIKNDLFVQNNSNNNRR